MRFIKTAALLALLPVYAFAADVTGTWTASFETQIGVQSYTFELKVDGAALTGMAKSGNVVSDNEIQFTRDVAGIAKEEFVAKRSQ
jgi:hypothetical protein